MTDASKFQNIKTPYLTLLEQDEGDVGVPDADTQRLFIDPADNHIKAKDETDTVRDLESGASIISDAAYDATSWNGDTTHAPSKNVIRDKIESMGAATVPASLYVYMYQNFK